jgi:hypothetical protein
MDVGIGRACPHNIRACRLVRGRQSCCRRIKRPHDHPVGSDLDCWTCLVRWVRVTSLRSARQHVGDTRNRISWLRFVSLEVGRPLHRRGVGAHGRVGNDFWIARHTSETVAAFSQHYHTAPRVCVNDPCRTGDFGWSRRHGTGNFHLRCIIRTLLRMLYGACPRVPTLRISSRSPAPSQS